MELIAQKRFPKRTASFLRAALESEGRAQEVCVRDISVNGALLDIAEPLPAFAIVTLICGDTRINGIVAWCDDGRLGMEFSELVSGTTLVEALQGRMKVSAPKRHQSGRGGPDQA